jgi:hypothetical protein
MPLKTDAPTLLDTPLEQWSLGYLKFETASMLNCPEYIRLHDHEKRSHNYPVSREEMIQFLRSKGGYQ